MHRTLIVGSPRDGGRSATLASEIFDACIDECPDDGVSVVSVSGMDISGCIGCDVCRKASVGRDGEDSCDADSPLSDEGDEYHLPQCGSVKASDANEHVCFMDDDMRTVREHIDAADELIVVCPVYFASAPSQMKALMDRLQPYYWSNLRKGEKRPMTLHIVGEGGDPHGFDPLIGSVRSAFSVAGFELVSVLDWVGCIDRTGEIMMDAEEIIFDE